MTFNRIKRYLLFSIEYFIFEKTRGLDFTMRDLHLSKHSKGTMHGYSKVNERHLRMVFDYLQISPNDSLLDIGCGKGVVLKEARKYPFDRVAGIEIQDSLINTAKRNMEILNLGEKVECIQQDALYFDHYGEYTIFFMFNPFNKEIVEQVVNKIVEQTRGRKKQICIIYHNPVYARVIEDTGLFFKEREFFDPMKQYSTYVYKCDFEASLTDK